MREEPKKLLLQFARFGVVGVIATLVDVGLLMLLSELLKLGVLVASGISFSTSMVVNYLLSMRFVFQGKGQSKNREFLLFVGMSLGGLCLNQLLMWAGTTLGIYYLGVKLFALVVVTLYNFITRKLFLEKRGKNE